jgi:hypothetical protein
VIEVNEDRVQKAFCAVGDGKRLLHIWEDDARFRTRLLLVLGRSARCVGEQYIAISDDKATRISFQATYKEASRNPNSSEDVTELVSDLQEDFKKMLRNQPICVARTATRVA